MKKLIKSIGLLVFVILFINLIVSKFFLPNAWGDKIMTAKLNYFEKHQTEYNALFFGASLVYRQINPSTIDQMVDGQNFPFKSYNMGADAHNLLQQMEESEYIIKSNPQVKYIFLSLSSGGDIFWANLHTTYMMHWIKLKTLKKAIPLVFKSNYLGSLKKRLAIIRAYITSFTERLFHFGAMEKIIENQLSTTKYYNGPNQNGFYPYRDKSEHIMSINQKSEDLLFIMRKKYLHDDKMRNEFLQKNFDAFSGNMKYVEANHLLKIINNYIRIQKEQGIHVTIILPPRLDQFYNVLLPLFEKLDDQHKINMADPNIYPQFYTVNNSFNFRHLNEIGANLYSKELGLKIKELLN